MQEVIVKIDGVEEKINATHVFPSKNPATQRFCVNLYYKEKYRKKWVQVFCGEEYLEEPARELAKKINEGKITDLTGYLAERR